MKISIQKFIIPGIPFAMFLIVISLLLWAINFVTRYYFQILPTHNTAFGEIENIISWDKLTFELSGVLIMIFNTFLLLQLNTKFSLIRTRSFLHAFLFLMSVSVWSAFHISPSNHLSLTFIIFSIMLFMDMYRNTQAVRQAFTGSFLLGISSFLTPEFILLLPAFWIGFLLFQCMSLRTFLATIFGILTPWILYISIRWYLQPDFMWLVDLKYSLTPALPTNYPPLYISIFVAVTLLILFVSLGNFYNNMRLDSIQTRQRLKLFFWLMIATLILSALYMTSIPSFLTLAALCFSMILAHPLSLHKSLLNAILLLILCLMNITFVVINFLFHTSVWN